MVGSWLPFLPAAAQLIPWEIFLLGIQWARINSSAIPRVVLRGLGSWAGKGDVIVVLHTPAMQHTWHSILSRIIKSTWHLSRPYVENLLDVAIQSTGIRNYTHAFFRPAESLCIPSPWMQLRPNSWFIWSSSIISTSTTKISDTRACCFTSIVYKPVGLYHLIQ